MERITIEGIALHLSDKEEVMQQGDNPDHAAITTKVFYLDSNMSKQWNVENRLSQPPDLRKKKNSMLLFNKDQTEANNGSSSDVAQYHLKKCLLSSSRMI